MLRGSVSSLAKIAKKSLAVAAAICLAVLASAAFAQDDDPPQAGRLSIVNGTVSIQPVGAQQWGQAYRNYPVAPGDRIYTDADGRAEIEVGQTHVRVGPDSDVTFVDFTPQAITFGAAQGALHIRTRGLWEGQSLYVQTPSGSTTVTAPADFRVDVYSDQQAAIFTNYGGDVYVSGANDLGMDTQPGQSLELVGTNPVYPQWLQPAAADDLDQWSETRDQQIARAVSYRYVSPDAPGIEDLDSNGEWTPGTDYGDMWFPNVPAGWAPYHNGHWVNHAPWGWVWVADEPWGYTPFHYGRWANYRGRWGWIPGPRAERAVWSPALVAFAGGIQAGGGALSVWFPLGPGEPYRPWYRCSPRYVDRVNITNIQPTRVVHVQNTYVNVVNVTNVNNVTYVNRTMGATAMRQQDFASGRHAGQAAVHVDPRQMAQAQVLARPQAAPTPQATIIRPTARPVPVRAARPVLINAKGMAVAAQPKAASAPPPVKAAPQPARLPNRVAVAPPPNVKMTPAARQAMESAPLARGGQPPAPVRPTPQHAQPPAAQPVPHQGQQPAAAPPAPNAQRPAPIPATPPKPAPIPAPGTRPPAQPEQQNPARPPERTAPAPVQPPRTNERPVPQPPPPPRSAEHPGPPPPQQTQPQRPVPRSVPEPPPPPSRQPERSIPPPEYHQPARPPAQPQPRPEARPEPRPEPQSPAHAAPPRPEPRPETQPPAHAAPPRQAPPPQNGNDKRQEDKQKPQPPQ
ncbi:MAG TPA: DUF6600 domain-containing protein [Terracidiphilus sp.]|nr:DUF6600 domain-containing protein [Terracidiphilus sp.]